MANRCVLHKKHLEPLKKYLNDNGWTIEPVKGEYEVLRARLNSTGRSQRRTPLIIYSKLEAKEHYSVLDRDMCVIRDFLRHYSEDNKGER